MPWVPQLVITDGAFQGSTPDGSLDALVNYFAGQGITTETAGCHSNGVRYYSDNEEPYIYWSGAYGSNGLLIRDFAPTGSRFLYAEFPVDKKETAAFWRQSICVYGEIRKHEYTSGDNTYYDYEFQLDGFTRRVYQNQGDTIPLSEETLYSQDTGVRYIIGGYDGIIPRYHAEYKRVYFAFGWITVGQERYWGCAMYCLRQTDMGSVNTRMSNGCYLMGVSETQLKNRFVVDIFQPGKKDDPNDDDEGDSDEGGGNGDHDKTEDNIPEPDLPPISAAQGGFITMFRMSVASLQSFTRELLDPTPWGKVKAFFNDPLDFIVGLMLVPFAPAAPAAHAPRFGDYTWSQAFPKIYTQFHIVDCGSHTIPKFYDGCFDYNPYTRVKIYLPYIGYRDLDADDVIGQTIRVKYHIDCLTGACVAFVIKVNPVMEQVIGQYSGNVGIQIPFGRVSYDNTVASAIQILGGAVGMAAGGIAGAVGGGGGDISAQQLGNTVESMTMSAVNSQKVTTELSGTNGSSVGMMSIQKPFVIRWIPHQSLPANYRQLEGYPSNIGDVLGSFSGYCAVESIDLSGVGCTETEKDELITILKGGFYR